MAHGADPPQPGNRSGGWRRERPLAAGKSADTRQRPSVDRPCDGQPTRRSRCD